MKCSRHVYGDALVLSLDGRLDHETTPLFREDLAGALRQAAGDQLSVVLDLAHLEYLSSPGLNALIVGARNARKEGVAMHAAGLQAMVQRSWEISHLTLVVQTFPSLEEALQVVSAASANAYTASKKTVKA